MLRISLSRSLLIIAALVLIHAAAAACLLIYVTALPWGLAGTAVVMASLVFHGRRDALLLAPDSLVEILLREDGGCVLRTRNGAVWEGRVMKSTFVSTLLVVINVRPEAGGYRSLVVLPDSTSAEQRRRLRVWLRYAVRMEQTGSAGF